MSKELEALEKICDVALCDCSTNELNRIANYKNIIETALKDYDLLKRTLNRNWVEVVNDDKKLKALEIIKEKRVDVGALYELNLELYNKYVIEINGTPTLTQEEYDLLKEVLL